MPYETYTCFTVVIQLVVQKLPSKLWRSGEMCVCFWLVKRMFLLMVLLMSDGFSWDWKDTNVSRRRKWGQGSLPVWPQVQLCKSSYISAVCVGVWLGGGGGIFVCIASVQVQALTSMSSLTTWSIDNHTTVWAKKKWWHTPERTTLEDV